MSSIDYVRSTLDGASRQNRGTKNGITMLGVNDNRPLPVVRRTTMTLEAAIDSATDRDSSDQGASMVEYALLLILVLLVAFFTVQVFGDSLVALFETSGSTLDNAPNVNPEG